MFDHGYTSYLTENHDVWADKYYSCRYNKYSCREGKCPIRITGEIPSFFSRYPDISVEAKDITLKNFHRYIRKASVGQFDTEEHVSAALVAAETQLRLNPGPGIHRQTPLGGEKEFGIIWIFHVNRLGAVMSHWDEVSRSVINETGKKHAYRDGFVIRQASVVGKEIWITTLGEGVNTDRPHAWRNGNGGPAGFIETDLDIAESLATKPGSQRLPMTAYQSYGPNL